MKKLSLLIVLFCSPTFAELYDCNGVWKDVPCDAGKAKTKLKEKVEKSEDEIQAKKNTDTKKSLVHDLTMSRLKAKKEHGIKVDYKYIEDYCQMESTSVEECRTRVENASDKLISRIEKKAEIKKKELELLKEKNKIEKEASQVRIEIYDRNRYKDGHYYRDDTYLRNGNYQRKTTTTSGSLSVSGSSASGNSSIGGNSNVNFGLNTSNSTTNSNQNTNVIQKNNSNNSPQPLKKTKKNRRAADN